MNGISETDQSSAFVFSNDILMAESSLSPDMKPLSPITISITTTNINLVSANKGPQQIKPNDKQIYSVSETQEGIDTNGYMQNVWG